jgi:hypothetical protein
MGAYTTQAGTRLITNAALARMQITVVKLLTRTGIPEPLHLARELPSALGFIL